MPVARRQYDLAGLQHAERHGEAVATAFLGIFHLSGWVWRDREKALSLLRRIVQPGKEATAVPVLLLRWCEEKHEESLRQLGCIALADPPTCESEEWRAVACLACYFACGGPEATDFPISTTASPETCRRFAQCGAEELMSPPCCAALAALTPDNAEKDEHVRAADLYEIAANSGVARGIRGLGRHFSRGFGRPESPPTAIGMYKRAAEQGHAAAQYNVGCMYDAGRGVQQDTLQAKEWYEKAAAQGDTDAWYNLAGTYRNGCNEVPQDYARAVQYYQLAADQGHTLAQYQLGRAYRYGDCGLEINGAESIRWLQMATDGGDEDAMCELAVCYFEGHGVPADMARAEALWMDAARLGHENAQYALGSVLRNPDLAGRLGIPKKALEMLRLSAAQGVPEAQRKLLDLHYEP